jgi:hypothetical protein
MSWHGYAVTFFRSLFWLYTVKYEELFKLFTLDSHDIAKARNVRGDM